MDELLAQFLVEGPALAQAGADALMALERNPADRAALDEAFRAVHTLKGSVGLFDLPAMGRVLHRAEDVMGALRTGERAPDAAAIGVLLAVLTQTERWLAELESAGRLGGEAEGNAAALIARLEGDSVAEAAAAPAHPEKRPAWAAALLAALPPGAPAGLLQAIRYAPAAEAYFSGDDPVAIVAATPGLAGLRLTLAEGAGQEDPYDPFTCRLVVEALSSASADAVRAAFRFVPDQVEILPVRHEGGALPDTAGRPAEPAARTLRVEAGRVDALAALAGELAAVRAALGAVAAGARAAPDVATLAEALGAQSAALDRVAARLHEGVMALRMVAVAPLLRPFPRLVREMAEGLSKDIEVTVDDGAVEADKAIVEGLPEPLTHLVRNAVDHGIEPAPVRVAAGKPARARIALSARAEAGRLVITLTDDGRGIDPAAIRTAVAARGLMEPERLAALSDAEAVELIFLPGFSTAERVTDLSGRGVGMDAVRAAVQALGGRIAVSSRLGQGTRVELSLPLAVSLTKVLVVADGQDRYGVPMDQVLETVRLPAAAVTPIRGGHAFNWRDRATPLLPLSALTGGEAALAAGDHRVMVVRAAGQPVGIAVERIDARLDVAMRPLSGLLAGMPGVSGTALLGDGRVLMILDAEALIP